MASPTNQQLAELLERIADLLEENNDNPFRVRAYREGAQAVRDSRTILSNLIHQDRFDALTQIPNIGDGIAAVIGEYVSSGRSALLEDLESMTTPEHVFAQIPGLGTALAQRVVEQLHIHTLAELEQAANDGRLAAVDGFGKKRVESVVAALERHLKRTRRPPSNAQNRSESAKERNEDRPSVDLLLEIDSEYRRRAAAGQLHKIAPRRFNPDNEAWLPVFDVKRNGWTFNVLFSNTAQAHSLGKTHDWVVIYYERDGKQGQHTVVTETKGPLKGKRVVRGREAEMRRKEAA